MRSGLGLRFVRELEQGKTTVRMDKVNVALAMFGMECLMHTKNMCRHIDYEKDRRIYCTAFGNAGEDCVR